MRLINTHTLALEEFLGADIPKYAILSHTWEKEEVILGDWAEIETMSKRTGIEQIPTKLGYKKIDYARKQAIQDGLDYLWVDTNCIDKSSSAELSEAINSMFAWYREAAVCYAYLTDFCSSSDDESSTPALRECRWFTRGWTLQELLAPTNLIFYSRDWEALGSKQDLATEIYAITRIPEDYITGRLSIFSASVAHRMSWVSRRATTRPEDIAYCMLGLFDINMPLIYGEGSKAFIRLQEEIIKGSADETLFCWTSDATVPVDWVSMLAPTPSVFTHSDYFQSYRLFRGRVSPYSVTNHGLSISLPLLTVKDGFLGLLNAVALAEGTGAVAIFLQGDLDTGVFTRARYPLSPVRLPESLAETSNYLEATEDIRQNIFVRMKADTIRMPSLYGNNLLHGRRPDGNSSHEVLLLFGGSSYVYQMVTLPAGRLIQGGILSLQASISSSSHQVDHFHGMDGVILQFSTASRPRALLFFGVKRQHEMSETVWFCKALDPYEGDLGHLPNSYVEDLVKKHMSQRKTSQVLDIDQGGFMMNLGEEFDSGHGCRMRVAHVNVEPFKVGID